ncbi:MAG: hypothetical protein ACR2NP_17880, partial [Pirellulaceae bacterium]
TRNSQFLWLREQAMTSSHDDKAAAADAESMDIRVVDEQDVSTSDEVTGIHSVEQEFDLNDFDDEFDDDFEAETAGEYEMDDDEYARQLADMVDFEIEGLIDDDSADEDDMDREEAGEE